MPDKKLHDVYLALGTNLGDKEKNMMLALQKINERVGMLIAHSSFYVTEPVGFESENTFVNAACIVCTSLSPKELLDETQAIEKDLGRMTKSQDGAYADRIIDIDIIFYDNLIFNESRLNLPHPHMHTRTFVLDPLAEIAGDYVHPILGKTLSELQSDLKESA